MSTLQYYELNIPMSKCTEQSFILRRRMSDEYDLTSWVGYFRYLFISRFNIFRGFIHFEKANIFEFKKFVGLYISRILLTRLNGFH